MRYVDHYVMLLCLFSAEAQNSLMLPVLLPLGLVVGEVSHDQVVMEMHPQAHRCSHQVVFYHNEGPTFLWTWLPDLDRHFLLTHVKEVSHGGFPKTMIMVVEMMEACLTVENLVEIVGALT